MFGDRSWSSGGSVLEITEIHYLHQEKKNPNRGMLSVQRAFLLETTCGDEQIVFGDRPWSSDGSVGVML